IELPLKYKIKLEKIPILEKAASDLLIERNKLIAERDARPNITSKDYGKAIKDKEREKEAQELENAEGEDVIGEECTNIIGKTRDNFLNELSIKYLFNKVLALNGKKISLKEVENFQTTSEENINICFSTIQGLHSHLNTPRENSLTYEDFQEQKIVLISDEAHHINVETKAKVQTNTGGEITISGQISQEEKEEIANPQNVLLEFTATVDFNNPNILKKYAGRLIYDYPLKKFREDGYSKEVKVMQTDAGLFDRALQAVLLSQYRRKIFEKNKLVIKPVILFKSKTINESKVFEEEFIKGIRNLTAKKLSEISASAQDDTLKKVFEYLENNKISLENFVIELQEDFSSKKTISVNSKEESVEKQILVNTLEGFHNECRVIFAVDKLNEEAQLIGRGARYCPFKTDDFDNAYQRKYDRDIQNEMRICEELYYHSTYNPRYIQELTSVLVKTGIIPERAVEKKLFVKKDFKNTKFYKTGFLFLNEKEKYSRKDVFELPSSKYFPNLDTLDEFISQKEYLGDIKIVVSGLANQLEQPLTPDEELTIISDKVLNFATDNENKERELGKSMKDVSETNIYLDISSKPWYVFDDCFGTSEEKHFVKYIDKIYDKLQEKYDEIYLVRNERFFKLYTFEDGSSLEPDYILFLQQKNSPRSFHYQIFVEPKVILTNQAPYQQVLSHGFVVDEKGQKMSKSLGNVIDPEEIINKFGADVLRLWVVSSDFTKEIKVSTSILEKVQENYQKIRNTLRFLLGNLTNLPPELKSEKDLEKNLSLVDYYTLHQLEKLVKESEQNYTKYNFTPIYSSLLNFCINDLSSFYLDISKDNLYCDPISSPRRKQIITTFYYLLGGLLKVISPILPYLAEEIYQNIPFQFGFAGQESVYLANFSFTIDFPNNFEKKLEIINNLFFPLRQDIFQALEKARQEKTITANNQAKLTIYLKKKEQLDYSELNLVELLGVAELKFQEKSKEKMHEGKLCFVYVEKTEKERCLRCRS
ncbi:3184_t:CDS:2, partial [Funneliformis geosporum]